MRTRVKFCGITRPEDAQAAANLGVDAIGLVFYPPSPRAVTLDQAKQVVSALPAFVTTVALFVDPDEREVEAVIDELGVDLLQFHGDESVLQCQQYRRPYIKALRMRDDVNVLDEIGRYSESRGLLLDSYQPGVAGGTGKAFDWARIPSDVRRSVILAGGLDADNVAQAIEQVRPYAVDVSGGIESAKGIKDREKMKAFMRSVNSVR